MIPGGELLEKNPDNLAFLPNPQTPSIAYTLLKSSDRLFPIPSLATYATPIEDLELLILWFTRATLKLFLFRPIL